MNIDGIGYSYGDPRVQPVVIRGHRTLPTVENALPGSFGAGWHFDLGSTIGPQTSSPIHAHDAWRGDNSFKLPETSSSAINILNWTRLQSMSPQIPQPYIVGLGGRIERNLGWVGKNGEVHVVAPASPNRDTRFWTKPIPALENFRDDGLRVPKAQLAETLRVANDPKSSFFLQLAANITAGQQIQNIALSEGAFPTTPLDLAGAATGAYSGAARAFRGIRSALFGNTVSSAERVVMNSGGDRLLTTMGLTCPQNPYQSI